MRAHRLLPCFLSLGCATAVPTPAVVVEVRGEGDPQLVQALQVRLGASGDEAVTRRVYSDDIDYEVSIAQRTSLQRVIVESEEGVDVVTFVVDADPGAPWRRCLLRVARKNCQIALVVQSRADASEHTLSVFPPP